MNHRVTSSAHRRVSRSMAYRRRRLRLVVLLLAVAGVAFLATARLSCGGDAQAAPTDLVQQGVTAKCVPPPLPDDPFRRCAVKALRGDYGTLVEWKRCAYEWGLARGVTVCGLAKVTSYGPWESPEMSGGNWTASGTHVSEDECAANPEIPFGTIIWTPYGLRRVEDRGGWVKVGFALVRGRWRRVTCAEETANFDYYSRRPLPTLRRAPWARVKY